jgi:hypothetical protein
MSNKIFTLIAVVLGLGFAVVAFRTAIHLPGSWERGDVLEGGVLGLLVVWFICDRFEIGWWSNEDEDEKKS